MSKLRMDKFLSSQLNLSRADAKRLLREGRVTLNGQPVRKGEQQLDPERDAVCLDGERIGYAAHLYLMLHKPQGVVSSTDSPGDVTVVDLVPEPMRRPGLFPAGRLDKDTTGFVLLTDDGAFAHEILAPGKHVPKTYHVTLTRRVTRDEQREIEAGLDLPDVRLKPAALRFLHDAPDDGLPVYEIVLTQGIYHQIKRMFLHFGNPVVRLHRVSIGALTLDPALAPGDCRLLSDAELQKLRSKN